MKHFRLLFLVLLISTLSAHSQSIKGKLVDLLDSKPLQGATLTLSSLKDSANSYNAISDSTGVFRFQNLPVDSFFIKVSYSGYSQYRQIVATNDSIPQIDLGTLFIPKSTTELGGVTVVSKIPPAQQKGDTLQLNASQFKVNPDATTEDLIKKMPGITVARDGTVTAQGEQVRKVTIDGREFFGDDATAALRNLPSDVVDKIQVFDRMSDQAAFTGFDDGNSQKALNIVTKSGIKNGQFGRIYAGYGTDERYSAGGNVSFFKGDRRLSFVGNFNNINQQNFASQDLLGVTSSGGGNRGGGGNFGGGGNRGGGGGAPQGGGGFGGQNNFSVGQQSGISKTNGIGINFSDKWGKKLDMQGSYFFNHSNTVNEQISRSTRPEKGKERHTDETSISEATNFNHRLNLRFEYRIDSSNSLIINPSLNFQKNESDQAYTSQIYYGENDSISKSNGISNTNRDGYNLRNNILYRHNFAKRGRTFSVNLNTVFNKNDGESYNDSRFRFYDAGVITDSTQNQFRDNPTSGYTFSGNISYTEPIGKKGQLQFSYAPSYAKNKADQQTFNYDTIAGKYSEFSQSLSNRFDNITTTQNAGISYRLGASRDNQFSIGVNFQNSRLESDRIFPSPSNVDQSFNNILPNLQWSKKVSAKSSFRIFYRASTNFPSVTQLQDVVDPSNPLSVTMGNPNLKQSYTHFVSGRYTFTNTQKGQSFFANIFLQTADDYITNAVFTPDADSTIEHNVVVSNGAQLTKPVNLNGYKTLRTFFTYSMPVSLIKSTVNLNAGFSYSKLPGQLDQAITITDNYVYNGGVVVASNISEYVDFNLSYNIASNVTKSTSKNQGSNNYVNQAVGGQVNLLTKSGWFLQNDLNYQLNSGLAVGADPDFLLWNAGIGKKFLKNKAGELKLSVFDLLKQNQSLTRTVGANNEVTDLQNTVLQRYFLLTFTYSLKNFGTARSSGGGGFQRRPGGPGGMNF